MDWKRLFGLKKDELSEVAAVRRSTADPIAEAREALARERVLVDQFSSAIAESYAGVRELRLEEAATREEIAKLNRLKDAAAHRNDASAVEQAVRLRLEAEQKLQATIAAIETAVEGQEKLKSDLLAAEERIRSAEGRLRLLQAEAKGVALRTAVAENDLHAQESVAGATGVVDAADRKLDDQRAEAMAVESMVQSARPPEMDLTDDRAVADEVQAALRAAGHGE